MKSCPNCKRKIEDNATFCEYCGYQIKRSKKPLWIALAASGTALLVGLVIGLIVNHNHKQQEAKEESMYANCQTAADYRYYLSVYPKGQYAMMAQNRIEELRQDSIQQQLDLKAMDLNAYENCRSQKDCMAYLEKFPNGEYVNQVVQMLNRMMQDSLNTLVADEYYSELSDANDLSFAVNGVAFVMKQVEGGTFTMGSGDADYKWENPVHNVTVGSFCLGETEVTQALWKAVMGNNPSHFIGDNLPVENVSYNEIVNEFLPRLNRLTGMSFRLPTEAEWEYAAKGGSRGSGSNYAGNYNIDNVAWYWQNTGDRFLGGSDDDWNWDKITSNNGRTRDVKGKSPNELGIYGMSGNVWEWCSDAWYQYSSSSESNPNHKGDAKSNRVLRGGGWCSRTTDCRVTFRCGKKPDEQYDKWGFRLALATQSVNKPAQGNNNRSQGSDKPKQADNRSQGSDRPKQAATPSGGSAPESSFNGEIFQIVEEMPQYPGGEAKMMEFIGSSIKYPQIARETGIQGRVCIGFIIEPDGSVSNVKVLRGIGGGCDEEAVRVIKSMPKWKPGKQRGEAVRVSYQIPLNFKLSN